MQPRNKNIAYLGVPFRSGCNREGAQFAPMWLLKNLAIPVEESRIMPFQTEANPLLDTITKGVKNYDAVLYMIEALREDMINAIEYGKSVLVLGGDHSIAMGSISAVLKRYPNLGVIWFDAHTDINTEATSPSSNAHGMPLAALMGLCRSDISNQDHLLNPMNVYWVGARDIDAGEWETIQRLGIEDHVFSTEKIRRVGMRTVMHQIRAAFQNSGVEQLHLSFDIDGMDPLIIPATGTPVKHGINEIECDAFINELSEGMPQMVSMDFVEYNPLMDDSKTTTGKWCVDTLSKLSKLFD